MTKVDYRICVSSFVSGIKVLLVPWNGFGRAGSIGFTESPVFSEQSHPILSSRGSDQR